MAFLEKRRGVTTRYAPDGICHFWQKVVGHSILPWLRYCNGSTTLQTQMMLPFPSGPCANYIAGLRKTTRVGHSRSKGALGLVLCSTGLAFPSLWPGHSLSKGALVWGLLGFGFWLWLGCGLAVALWQPTRGGAFDRCRGAAGRCHTRFLLNRSFLSRLLWRKEPDCGPQIPNRRAMSGTPGQPVAMSGHCSLPTVRMYQTLAASIGGEALRVQSHRILHGTGLRQKATQYKSTVTHKSRRSP